MATILHTCVKVPGLNQSITDCNLTKSVELYNGMPEILEVSERHQLPPDHLVKLGGLITEYGLQNYIGIHESHSHGLLSGDYVLIGKDYDKPLCRRVQQVRSSQVDPSKIYGRLFVLDDEHRLHPYEYQQGAIPENIQELASKFVPRYIEYLETHTLGRTISLEILRGDSSQSMSEIVWGSEITLWPSDRVVQQNPNRTTGWSFSPEGHSDSSNWVGTSKGHQEVEPPPESLPEQDDLEAQLVREGVLISR